MVKQKCSTQECTKNIIQSSRQQRLLIWILPIRENS